jgi:hypothetical protein
MPTISAQKNLGSTSTCVLYYWVHCRTGRSETMKTIAPAAAGVHCRTGSSENPAHAEQRIDGSPFIGQATLRIKILQVATVIPLPSALLRPLQTVQRGAESVSSLRWNGCPVCRGISVQVGVENAAMKCFQNVIPPTPYQFALDWFAKNDKFSSKNAACIDKCDCQSA